MKKITFLTVALVAVLAIGVGTAGAQNSIGYQGLLGTGTNMLSGLSYRGWSDAIGYEGTFFYGGMSVEPDYPGADDIDASIWALDLQVMYAVIQNTNSKLYIGADLAFGGWSADYGDDASDNIWWIGPCIGAQYSFQEMPELTFNWEVAWDYADIGVDDDDVDVSINGFNTTLGVHYAF